MEVMGIMELGQACSKVMKVTVIMELAGDRGS
jgi:hypothetical protein